MKIKHLTILENVDLNARTAMEIAKEINQNLEDLRHISAAGSSTGAGHEHNFNSLGQDVINLGHELKKLGYVYDPKSPGMIRKSPGKMFEEGKKKGLPGQFGAVIISPEEFVAADEAGIDVDPNLEENTEDRQLNRHQLNRLWQMIRDYEQRAKLSKNDLRKEHFKRMADELRGKLPTSDLEEATKLPAQQREFGGQEFQDYMKRIQGTPDIDKKTGKVKVGKDKVNKKTGEVTPGAEKYISGKTKTDKYKMPYMHRSSVITYVGPDGTTYNESKVIKALKQRPKKLLKQNEKMKHSNGAFEQFFNVGFAALTGIAVDESTGKLIIVNTCPGAGSCKVDCFAMKGGKVQFKNAWLSDGKILTYLLNDPDGFFNQLSSEIKAEADAGKKGDKKFPNGWEVTIRWHDAGDFFSTEYLDLALNMAKKHPDVKFYAYTKMAGAALAKKPDNFIINWSEGAHTSQEKQVKAADPELEQTKNSRIVPDEIFQDLLVKNEKGNLIKGESGQWQVQPDKLPELKQRLGQAYKLSPSSILSYDEYTSKPKTGGMKYNVIVAPGEGDISANDPNVLSTLLLRH